MQQKNFNNTKISPETSASILDLFKQVVQIHPGRFAIKEDKCKITFKELSIPINSVLSFTKDNSINCNVIKETPSRVLFEEQESSLSSAALKALNNMGFNWISARGGDFWKYEDETLTTRRLKLEY